MINITTDAVNSIVSATSSSVQELLPIIAVIFSVVLAFYGARKIIFLITLTKR